MESKSAGGIDHRGVQTIIKLGGALGVFQSVVVTACSVKEINDIRQARSASYRKFDFSIIFER